MLLKKVTAIDCAGMDTFQSCSRWRCLVLLISALAGAPALQAQSSGQGVVAPTPPMGWNSWDSYGLSVTEQEFRANAEIMAQHLKRYGWEYAVVDEGWYLQNPDGKPGTFRFSMDTHGRYTPAVNRFLVGSE